MARRSDRWFQGPFDNSFEHRSVLRAIGHPPESFVGKPIIGIANSWSDLNNCNLPHKHLVEHVKRGVLTAGGFPVEFHTLSTQADLMKPSDLMYRNLMAMDLEEYVRSMPIDGLVLLCECDKTCPAQLMAAVSCDVPALQLAAGHRDSGWHNGERVTYGTDMWRFFDQVREGSMSPDELSELEGQVSCSLGGCAVMGTASTMKSVSEILGMMLPGTASIAATHAQRVTAAERTGQRIVEMIHEDLRPSKLITDAALRNAIRLLAAMGGSTNALIHLSAIAARRGTPLAIEAFEAFTRDIPLLANLQPSGRYTMDDYARAGGIAALIGELLELLEPQAMVATGKSLHAAYANRRSVARDVIGTLASPISARASLRVLHGNLAPSGAVIKASAATPELLTHIGKAVVFEDYHDMLERIDSDALQVTESSVLVLRNSGPVGAGMPEWGAIPIPAKLLKRGVRDMVRISDARMSGTAGGTIVLHVAPEAAVGGALALVQDGDDIQLDVPSGQLSLLVDDAELSARRARWQPPATLHHRGYPRLFAEHVLQAPEGCDLDFMQPTTSQEASFVEPIVGRG